MSRQPSENSIVVSLIKYYEQKEALEKNSELDFTENGKQTTIDFYNEKITSLRKQLHGINPRKLQEIDTQRNNDCTVKEPTPVQR